jgi:phosphoglycolate phosphatase
VSDTRPVSLACCGLIGTTVTDNGMVERAYAEAIATQGVVTGTTAYARCMAGVHRSRGQATIDVLRSLFPESQARAQAAQLTFDRSYSGSVSRSGIVAMPGAELAIDKLRGNGIRVVLISGFSRKLLGLVMDTLGWWDRVDLALSPDEVPRGCPLPDPVLTAMLRIGVADVRETAVAHGTESGVQCGRRSGASVVAGVLTGTHPAQRLRKAGATHVLGSVAALPDLLALPGPAATVAGKPAGAGDGAGRAGAGAQVTLEGRTTGL